MDQTPPPFPPAPPPVPPRPKRVSFPQPAFKDAAGDLRSMFTGMNRRRWLFLGLSFAMTFALIYGFLLDSDLRKLGPGEQLIYAESWSANRTDAEIQAQQRRDQTLRKRVMEERQKQFQKLEKTLGVE